MAGGRGTAALGAVTATGQGNGLKYDFVTQNDVKVIVLPVATSGFHVINISIGGRI